MNKILHHTAMLHCNPADAFALFTQNDKLEQWLVVKAEVTPAVGGRYELFWNPEEREYDSTIGCRITSIVEEKLLAFEWKGPRQYADFMNRADPLTHVVVIFLPSADTDGQSLYTEIHLIHSGWRNSGEWEEARLWFEKAWEAAFKKLEAIVNS